MATAGIGNPGTRRSRLKAAASAILLLGLVAALPPPAGAHDPYAPYRTPRGSPCCNDDDCRPLADGDVATLDTGYFIRSRGEFVPNREAQPGPDDRYHLCTYANVRMCFLLPRLGM